MAPPPTLCSGWDGRVYEGATSRPMAQRKAAISRAIAATTTGGFLPVALRPAIAGTEPDLRLPGDVAHRFGQVLKTASQGPADPGREAVGPRGFDEGAAGTPISGERQARSPDRIARRAFSRNQAEERHQLWWRVEAAHISDLGRKGHGDQEGGTAHRLVGLDDRSHRPGRHDRGQLLVQAVQPLSRIRDCVDLFLEDDLLCRVLEGLTGKPTPVRQRPMPASFVDPAMAQEKGKHVGTAASRRRTDRRLGSGRGARGGSRLLTFAAQVVGASVASPDHREEQALVPAQVHEMGLGRRPEAERPGAAA